MEQGFLFFQMQSELGLMALGARQLLEPLGRTAAEPKTRALY
jgi:4-hydroxy-2-oxoheptanedioate aldolase